MDATGWNIWRYIMILSFSSKIVNKNCTIRCKKGSKVDLYCEEQGLKREYI